MRLRPVVGLTILCFGCSEPGPAGDAATFVDVVDVPAKIDVPEEEANAPDGGSADAGASGDGVVGTTDATSPDVGIPDVGIPDVGIPDVGRAALGLDGERDRLIATLGSPCEVWRGFDRSRMAVFLTISHRLFLGRAPDGSTMLSHVTRLYRVLGGGSSGSTCGGSENNRVFMQIDDALWGWLVQAWSGTRPLTDGAGSRWVRSRDIAGPHSPFTASDETETGLRCVIVFETGESRPPTGQVHFFRRDEDAEPVRRGSGVSLPADPRMLEMDLDFNCVHDSNPTCGDFVSRYVRNYGDFACGYVPTGCAALGDGCFRSVGP